MLRQGAITEAGRGNSNSVSVSTSCVSGTEARYEGWPNRRASSKSRAIGGDSEMSEGMFIFTFPTNN